MVPDTRSKIPNSKELLRRIRQCIHRCRLVRMESGQQTKTQGNHRRITLNRAMNTFQLILPMKGICEPLILAEGGYDAMVTEQLIAETIFQGVYIKRKPATPPIRQVLRSGVQSSKPTCATCKHWNPNGCGTNWGKCLEPNALRQAGSNNTFYTLKPFGCIHHESRADHKPIREKEGADV